tara:strand:- start:18 stop:161 length:144 start_codon:yes stop_codon:yes gene_type:complete
MNKILDDLIKINIRLNKSFTKTAEILSDNIKVIDEMKQLIDDIENRC